MQRIQLLEEEIQTKQKYEKILSEFELDVIKYKGDKKLNCPQCVEALAKFSHWQSYVQLEEGLSSQLKETMERKITTLITVISKRQDELEAECTSVLDQVVAASNVTDLKKIQQRLVKLSTNTSHATLERLVDETENLVGILERIPKKLGEFSEFSREINPELFSTLYNTFEKIVVAEESALKKKEEQWIASYCLSDETAVTRMDPNACTKWLASEETFPEYLSEQALTRWKSNKTLVENRLHESRVEGVIALFHHLSVEEQKACLEKLLAENPLL